MPSVVITARDAQLAGDLVVPSGAHGLVVFAHGSGSSRKSPRNRFVAERLQQRRLGTLLFDLLTTEEEAIDAPTGQLRFNIDLLARRLIGATDWVTRDARLRALRIGYFGASTGAAAALIAAAERPRVVGAVVSRGGRPDLAEGALSHVRAPTLLIVGGLDATVLRLNREAMKMLGGRADLEIIDRATHLFEERGALEQVADLAGGWFGRHLAGPRQKNVWR
jgi:putative phosphoribosyl transferase